MARAENDAGNPERRDLFCDRAVAAFADVLDCNPTDAYTHYEMGMTYLYYNYPLMTYVEKAKIFMRKALEVKPCDLFLNVNILYLYLTWWDQLTDDEKAYVLGQVRRIRDSDPAFMPQLEERWRQTFGSTPALDSILGSDQVK